MHIYFTYTISKHKRERERRKKFHVLSCHICELHRSESDSTISPHESRESPNESPDESPDVGISRRVIPHAHEPLPRANSGPDTARRKKRGRYEDRNGTHW